MGPIPLGPRLSPPAMMLPPSVIVMAAAAASVAKAACQVNQIRRAAGRARRLIRFKIDGQMVSAIATAHHVALKMDLSPFDLQMPAFNKKLCHLAPGSFHKTGKSRTGYFHFQRRVGMIKALVIRQTDRFELIES